MSSTSRSSQEGTSNVDQARVVKGEESNVKDEWKQRNEKIRKYKTGDFLDSRDRQLIISGAPQLPHRITLMGRPGAGKSSCCNTFRIATSENENMYVAAGAIVAPLGRAAGNLDSEQYIISSCAIVEDQPGFFSDDSQRRLRYFHRAVLGLPWDQENVQDLNPVFMRTALPHASLVAYCISAQDLIPYLSENPPNEAPEDWVEVTTTMSKHYKHLPFVFIITKIDLLASHLHISEEKAKRLAQEKLSEKAAFPRNRIFSMRSYSDEPGIPRDFDLEIEALGILHTLLVLCDLTLRYRPPSLLARTQALAAKGWGNLSLIRDILIIIAAVIVMAFFAFRFVSSK